MTAATAARKYIAAPGSPAHRLITHLVAHPDARMTVDDMVVQLEFDSSRVSEVLKRPLEVRAIERIGKHYALGNLATAQDAIGQDGDKVRRQAVQTTARAIAVMTASAHRPAASIDEASGEAWNKATAAVVALPSVVLDGQTLRIEHAPFYKHTRQATGRFSPVFNALAEAVPCPGMTVRCVLPVETRWKSVASALHRWHRQHGHAKPIIQLVRIKSDTETQTVLQRIPTTA